MCLNKPWNKHLSWHDLSLTTLTKCDEELFLAGMIIDLPQAPFIFETNNIRNCVK